MSQRKKVCVLLGELGSGKTRLFNTICGTNEISNSGMESNTLKIAQHESIHGRGFFLTDTPGVGATHNTFTHAIGILAALTDGPIDQILLVVKYNKRIDNVRRQIDTQIKLVQNYSSIITIIITYLDQCDNKFEYAKAAKEMIKKQFNISQTIFSFKEIPSAELCNNIDWILYGIQESSKQQQLSFSDGQFQTLLSFQDFDQQLTKAKKKLVSDFEQFYFTAKYFLSQFKVQTEEIDQILNNFTQFIKKYAQQNRNEMEELYNQSNDPQIAYIYLLNIKKIINDLIADLTKIICSIMKYNNDHPLRQYRKCPYCKIIWYRPQGCDSMKCGENSSKFLYDNDKRKNYSKQYEFQYNEKERKIILTKLQNPNLQSEYSPLQTQLGFIGNIKFEVNDQIRQKLISLDDEIKRKQIELYGSIGCREYFNWNDAELVDSNEIILNQEELQIVFSVKDDIEFNYYFQTHILLAQQEKKTIF